MTLTDDLDTLEWQRRRTAQLSGDPDATTNQLNDDLPADVWQRRSPIVATFGADVRC